MWFAWRPLTILTNHTTKTFFEGQSEPSSLHYLAQVLGDVGGRHAFTLDQHPTVECATRYIESEPRASAHTVRQMRPGGALLLHGTLPTAHIRTVPYYQTVRALRGSRS